MTMARPVRMPALGQTSDELRVIGWLKSAGEDVAEGEVLLEVETDKASLDVEAASSGVLLATLFSAGDVIEAGTVIAWIGAPGEEVPPDGPGETLATAPRESPASSAPAERPGAGPGRPGRRPASPAVRALAREHGVDIEEVRGTGPDGRVERADITAAIAATAGRERPEGTTATPVSPQRQAIARRLSRSAQVPQFSLSRTIDARRAAEAASAVAGATYTHVLLRSIAVALREHPAFNRVWADEGPWFHDFDIVNVGLAVTTQDTLLVVAVREPDRMDLAELAEVTRAVVAAARAGQLRQGALAPTPVTLSNLGMLGVDRFTPLLGPGQTAVLGTGRIAERPAVADGRICVVPQLDLTLTVDHRTADGAAAARFLQSVADQLES
jgi:pyruvate dehydrogenase E2 component (dihydrolipoamide acetyltransferase)